MITTYYRISNNSYNKIKPNYVTKLNCLKNYLKCFSGNINIICDNLTDDNIKNFIVSHPRLKSEFTNLGNAQSFVYCLSKSIEKSNNNEIIYFVEDDYIHRTDSQNIMEEGFSIESDFVSLYDHPDKYMDNTNPYVEDGGEETKIFLTKSCHWKFTNSTTMTFAAKVGTLKEVIDIIKSFTSGQHPNDFGMFIKFREMGKSLITPIPGYSTHGETKWLTPLINWEKEI